LLRGWYTETAAVEFKPRRTAYSKPLTGWPFTDLQFGKIELYRKPEPDINLYIKKYGKAYRVKPASHSNKHQHLCKSLIQFRCI